MDMDQYMLVLVAALLFAIGGTPLPRQLARRLGVMDQPGIRKIHTKAMPRLGGAAIYLTFILALVFLGDRFYVSQGVSILLGATLVSFCGIWEDRWGMRPLLKLGIGQPLAALILIASGIRVSLLPHPILNIFVTIVWVVGITNALNLLDNMDELSAGVATVASAFFLLLAAMSGQYLVGSLVAALLGACLGLLLYDFNPASVFLGDTGSLFIGFILAAVGIKLRFPGRMTIVTWMIPVLVLGVPIFDTILVVRYRLRRGLNPLIHPGRDHFSHRLVAMGFSQREAVLAIYLVCGALGVLAIFLTQASILEGYVIGGVVALLALYGLSRLELDLADWREQQRIQFNLLWRTWSKLIDDLMAEEEEIDTNMLVGVPSEYRAMLLQKYSAEHKEKDLVYDGDGQRLVLRNANKIRFLRATWGDILLSLKNDKEQVFVQKAAQLADCLCDLLGFSHPVTRSSYKQVHVFALDASFAFQETKLPCVLPLIFLQRSELQKGDLDDLRYLLSKQIGLSHHIALLLLLGDKAELEQAEQLLERLRKVYAYDVVALGKEDLECIVIKKDTQRALRKLILQTVDLVTVSPFVTSGPVPNNMFFGRDGMLREITEQVGDANFTLVGGRRIGKTSILHRLLRVRLPTAGYDAYYYGCEPTHTDKEFLKGTSHEWLESSTLAFTEILNQLQRDKSLVILLDEVDSLVARDAEAGYPLLSTFRSLSQSHKCHFVLCGEWTLQTELRNPNSPLFNFGNELLIGRLDYRAVEELVIKPFKQLEIGLVDPKTLVQRIYDFTSGHPNIVQRLCQRLVERLNEKPTRQLVLDDLDAVIANEDFLRRDFLDTFWERATILEKLITLVMTTDRNACTRASIREALAEVDVKTSVRQAHGALERLVNLRSILKRVPGGYEFAATAFPKVLTQTTTLADAIEYQKELYLERGDVIEV